MLHRQIVRNVMLSMLIVRCAQNDPAFCGLGTLVMVLNALAMDPGRVWKGIWRWYHEELVLADKISVFLLKSCLVSGTGI